MRKKVNKRKINKVETLQGRYVKRRFRVSPFVQVTRERNKKKTEKDKKRYQGK